MSAVLKAEPEAISDPLQITKAWLKLHDPCRDGFQWFVKRFPQGGQFAEVYAALRTDRRYQDADWLAERVFAQLDTPAKVQQTVKITGADRGQIAAQVQADGANPEATATTGYRANAATTGNWANAATTGNWANAATTGEGANAATTGYRANAATSGQKAIAAALGRNGTAKAGADGCVVVAWFDEQAQRPRVAIGYVGEDGIQADTWYRAEAGKLTEAPDVAR